ncbi:DNA repair protein rad2 [Teratosphaeriaceae sp. CCFEE 6253]|nr:DNA repair protein rad2 [Teratosphaeriaceae sp. CCFEE 6253]
MGVTDLWHILQPSARPIKIETLNRERLAVDASIWIYQFLKAVRDNEGNALRNSRVIGFFRRICKLLFFGIKPVFVFDGGTPALERQTISNRKWRREGRRDDAVRTAGKLLVVQIQRRAEEEEQRRKDEKGRGRDEEENEVPDESLVYVDELQMTHAERQQNRKFRKNDAYHLPEMQAGMHEMGGPNDPRVMRLEDLQTYARQFESGEDINTATTSGGFSGPLPFEKLDLGTSLLGKKKMQQRTEEAEGGFEKPDLATKQAKPAGRMPPWFNGDIEEDIRKQERLEKADREKARPFGKQFQFQGRDEPLLRRQETGEVIDVDDGEGKAPVCEKDVVGQSEVIELAWLSLLRRHPKYLLISYSSL